MAAAATTAAAVTKNGLLKIHRHRHSLRCSWQKTRSQHSIPHPPPPPPASIGNQLQQTRWCSRFPHSTSQKTATVISSSIPHSPNSGVIGWYLSMIKHRPIATKSITSALIYTAADLSSQTITGGDSNSDSNSSGYDLVRTLRMAGYGMLIIGPSLHYWFNFVSRVFPKRDLFSTFTKMVLGQMVYGPTVTALFFSLNAALQGESGSEIIGRLKRDLVPTLKSGVMYWPICDFVTFRFVPVHLQPLVSNSFSYLWTVYLTYMASLSKVSTS
ncbi:hypothetical protein ABFS82_14G104800 [Erythranthe guttata]|uniref:Uncharacterized protein n=3 Tax=Erythranthe guttata TaxID=4155 RepID=A0A022RUT8_ERYGU|nr:PREDICTED: PXMP2/4 family protein 4-like [Erythranthe guttata]EYU42710.1 hypothetical protein MIMGU_mgv1a011811mg [Erythranthe guttata]|eukprot:XP_012830987.1 PREDICTED: PXMP2/4 family protein 4-like [Erythranthe guttata]